MKNYYLLIMLLFISMTCALANSTGLKQEGLDVSLSVGYTNESPTDDRPGRTQMHRPVINITENLITVPELLIGCEMTITSEDGIVFSTFVTSTEILLPETLSGTYQIQFVNVTYTFVGEISL